MDILSIYLILLSANIIAELVFEFYFSYKTGVDHVVNTRFTKEVLLESLLVGIPFGSIIWTFIRIRVLQKVDHNPDEFYNALRFLQ